MIMLKFDIDEKVVTTTGKTGTIKSFRVDGNNKNGVKTIDIKYYVHFGGYASDWISEEHLKPYHDYDNFSPKFELDFLNLLIDVNLSKRNFEMVKYFNELKMTYSKIEKF
ncbi:hypothetical protein JK635_02370 [Neobacillus sp. YIM B02564]|uniref:Uncharacterized protein n=1 Tax=Neobacillus paridis TaxID=2803862 RepID=A0ABS1TID1_9BACI|nr:hypothetical protein [Neobacillus paridis]MBL4951085.1 hypothetical protein [Neobacillus paridis]